MIDRTCFRTTTVQVSLFTHLITFEGGRLRGRLMERLGDRLDGEPLVLPVPSEAPPGIPRILLRSKDERFALQASLSRIDVISSQVRWNELLAVDDEVACCLELGEAVVETTGARVNRAALVQNRAALLADPAVMLARHFCRERWWRERPLNRPENFELHAHKVYEFSGREINSWVRCKTGEIRTSDPGVEPEVRERGLVVEHDMNTVVPDDPATDVPWSDIREFISAAPAESEAVIAFYFPGD